MGKKKKQNNQIKTDSSKAPCSTFDDERITKIIVNALREYDKEKQKEAKAEEEKVQKGANKLSAFKALIFPRRYAKDLKASSFLLQSALQWFYKIIEIAVLLSGIFMLAIIPLQYALPNITPVAWYLNFLGAVLGVVLLVISRFFRIAHLEVGAIKDSNYLFGLFASVASIISIVIAIIAILK